MLQIATSSARAAWRVAARPSQAVRASHHRKLFDVPRGGVSLQHRTAGAATASAASVAATGRAAFGLGLVAAGGFGAATTFALAEPSDGSSSAVSLLGTYGLLRDGTYGVRSRAQDLPVLAADADTRVISLEEVREHTTEESLWVVYDGVVYDVTGFLKEHPGGMEAILGAGGQDLGAYWAKCEWSAGREGGESSCAGRVVCQLYIVVSRLSGAWPGKCIGVSGRRERERERERERRQIFFFLVKRVQTWC